MSIGGRRHGRYKPFRFIYSICPYVVCYPPFLFLFPVSLFGHLARDDISKWHSERFYLFAVLLDTQAESVRSRPLRRLDHWQDQDLIFNQEVSQGRWNEDNFRVKNKKYCIPDSAFPWKDQGKDLKFKSWVSNKASFSWT